MFVFASRIVMYIHVTEQSFHHRLLADTTTEMMQEFGWAKPEKRDWKFYAKHINRCFVFLTFFAFSCFALYNNISRLVFAENKTDLFENNLQDLAFYFMGIDKGAANLLLSIDDVRQNYGKNQDHFLKDNEGNLEYILQYLSNHPDQLKQL